MGRVRTVSASLKPFPSSTGSSCDSFDTPSKLYFPEVPLWGTDVRKSSCAAVADHRKFGAGGWLKVRSVRAAVRSLHHSA